MAGPEKLERGGLRLSMGVLSYLALPQIFKGKVAAELCFTAPNTGAMVIVALNRLRLIHLAMYHLGHECACGEALQLVDLMHNACVMLAGQKGAVVTPGDFQEISEMVYEMMQPDSQEDARIELAAIRLTGKHREPPTIVTAKTLPA
jgi:hypothetical protein